MIFGDRIKLARELNALTQEELAEKIELAQSAVAQFEAGSVLPREETLHRIAFATRFPISFFQNPTIIKFPVDFVHFRSLKRVPAKHRSQAVRFAELLYEIQQALMDQFAEIPCKLSPIDTTPEDAAIAVRQMMGLNRNEPIPHLMNVLERGGVTILPIPVRIDGLDAFSVWIRREKDDAVVAITETEFGDRQRMSIAHEIGHLVLHRNRNNVGREVEQEAMDFAAEFLMPAAAIGLELEEPITLSGLSRLKRRWGVSIQALIVRARDLEKVSQRRYHSLFELLSRHGWRKREPESLDILVEKPRALSRLMELRFGPNHESRALSALLPIAESTMQRLLAGYSTAKDMSKAAKEQLPFRRQLILLDGGMDE